MKRILFILIIFLVMPSFVAAGDAAMPPANDQVAVWPPNMSAAGAGAQALTEFYQPGEWETLATLTPADILGTLRIINDELAATQAALDAHDAIIPRDKKTAIDTLLGHLCTLAQTHMEQVQHYSKCDKALIFINSHREIEGAIAAQVAEIERLLAVSQSADKSLDALMAALTIEPAPDGDLAADLDSATL